MKNLKDQHVIAGFLEVVAGREVGEAWLKDHQNRTSIDDLTPYLPEAFIQELLDSVERYDKAGDDASIRSMRNLGIMISDQSLTKHNQNERSHDPK